MIFIADREDDSKLQTEAPVNNRKPSIIGEGYTPPANLYAFPPNVDASYPPPGDTRKPISISSYLPPPSGPTNYPIYPGPVMPKPELALNSQADNMQEKARPDMEDGNDNINNGSPDRPSDDMQQIFDKPPSELVPGKKPDVPLQFVDHDHDHDHEHDHDHPFDDHPPFSLPYSDDSLKHLHGFDAFPGILAWFYNTSAFDFSLIHAF